MSIEKFFEIVDTNFIKSNIHTILELGSRDGFDAIDISKHYSDANVITFECNPATFHIVENNIQGYNNIKAYKFAVTDFNGTIDFYQSTHGNPGSSSIFEKTGKYDHIENYRQKKIQVNSTRLDNFLDEHNIKDVDLIWADLQGSELKAFNGMGNRIDNVKVILTEVEYKEMYKGQPLYDDIKQYLVFKGFEEFYRTSLYDDWWGDAIFVNTRLIGS